ncbi:MAG: AMP-binding protein, partial [Gammaproteobacteria bacterium]
MLQETRLFPPPEAFQRQANISGMEQYRAMCDEAERDYAGFWGRLAREHLSWKRPFTKSLDESQAPFYKWFEDGELNVSWNCLDRHLGTPVENKTAIIFEADDGTVTKVTYRELYERVCRFASGLRALGYKKGERAIIYLPMSIQGIVAMQACARLGIIHSVVFGGFSAKSLHDRIHDAEATLVITADEQMRGGKRIPLKSAIDDAFAMGGCESVRQVIVYRRTGADVAMQAGRDIEWDDVIAGQPAECEPEWVSAEHPLFILYTSGSTGQPKGVQHSSGGYLLQAAVTMKWSFDLKPDDVFWCTADIGWVTGHSYVVYGPLQNGATALMFEGVPNWPDHDRFWTTVAKHKVSIFYTAPTAIRALMREGKEPVERHDLSSLRLL